MKIHRGALIIGTIVSIMLVTGVGKGICQQLVGKQAPAFTLNDVNGKAYHLANMKSSPMIVLYFFDINSQASQKGLLSLDELAKKYKNSNLTAWGITQADKKKIKAFKDRVKPRFPILIDSTDVSSVYHAKTILPTVSILGPGLKVLDFFQGGGKATEIMLVRLAERKLQQKDVVLAKAISDKVIQENPKNVDAKAVNGYAVLKEGHKEAAEKIFKTLAKNKGTAKVVGEEGLAAVYAQKGNTQKALEMVAAVEKKAPDRGYVNVIKGDILYSQNKKQAAENEFKKAVTKKTGTAYQKAVGYNKLGRIYASIGKFKQSHDLFDQAVAIDPYYIEATANKGLAYQKEGRWDDALKEYRKALSVKKDDTFAEILAQKAEAMIALQKDQAKKARIDKLVKELAERFRKQQSQAKKDVDSWTSRPMVLSFVDFQERGGLSEQGGFSIVLTSQLSSQLNASGRVEVVERVLLERLIEELNLGSSELADPETALKLGKVLAAKVIGTGTLFNTPNGTILSMRLIDTETSSIPKVVTRNIDLNASLKAELNRLNREIIRTIIEKYPLRGFIVKPMGDRVMINLGTRQGVVLGTRFEVLEDQEPIKYKGKELKSAPKSVGELKVISVEPDLSYAQIIKRDKEKKFKTDDKVQEKLADEVIVGSN